VPRSFDIRAESTAGVEELHATFGDEKYWLARLALTDTGAATLDALTTAEDGTVDVVTRLTVMRDRLPRAAVQLLRCDLEMTHNEKWSPIGDSRVLGTISASLSGMSLAALGEVILTPTADGSSLSGTGTVSSKIPLIGGTLERFVAGQLAEQIVDMQRFTSQWIAAGNQ
jgi:hypothetical protein